MPVAFKTKGSKWKRVLGFNFTKAKEFTAVPPDSIASVTVTVVEGDAEDLVVGTPSFLGFKVSVMVEGGVPGRKYILECTIVTTAGIVLTKQGGLQITEDAG
jgi:hypothetical protein